MSIDAMKQALEALEMLAKWEHPASNITTKSGRIYPHHVAKNSATTLRLAIEQAEKQEPVAWLHVQGNYEEPSLRQLDNDEVERGWEQYPLYTAPPQRQPLTDNSIAAIATEINGSCHYDDIQLARAIERAHGIGGSDA